MWFRNDLRVKDHEALWRACQNGNEVYPVYVFDPRNFSTTSLGFPRTGSFRGQFLLESVLELKISLVKLGGDLIVKQGLPEEVIPALAQQFDIDRVYCGKEVAYDEHQVALALEAKLAQKKIVLDQFWQSGLYHEEDVPWPMTTHLFCFCRRHQERLTLLR